MKTGLCAFLFLAACTSSSNNAPACGDGVVDPGEQCDDGNTTSGDGCSATCQTEAPPNVCGDGTVGGTEQCDDGNTTSGDGCSSTCRSEFHTTANWTFKNVGSSTALPCPNGYDTAAVYSQLLDASGNASGQPVIDLFTCSTGTGTTSELAQGKYDTWIAITNHDGTVTYAQTVDAVVDLTTASQTFSADIVEDGGYFGWKWVLQGAMTNNPLSCSQVTGIQGVELVTTVTNTTTSYDDMFTCTDGQGVTSAIPQGLYTVSADAFSSGGALGSAANFPNEQIQGPNKITDLGTITLPIDGQ